MSNDDVLITKIKEQVKRDLKSDHQQTKDKRLRNTKKLLESYTKLQSHVETAPDSAITPDMYKLLFGASKGQAEISKWQASTAFYMRFINATLDNYQAMCLAGDYLDRRRWRIIDQMYLQTPHCKVSQLAETYHVDKARISRVRDQALEDISTMLYGIMALVDDMACE